MRPIWLLVLLCACFWFDDLTSANLTTTMGHFIQTGPEYQDVLPSGAITKHLIYGSTITCDDPRSPRTALECGRRCLGTPNCSSIVLQPDERKCFLSSLNRCNATRSLLEKKDGFIYYDIIPGEKITGTNTCFATCIANSSCDLCGRENCIGNLCDNCSAYCWETPTPRKGSTTLWTSTLSSVKQVCNKQLQLYWDSRRISTLTDTPNLPLTLHLTVSYINGGYVTGHFSSVQIKNKRLSVGQLIEGTAGNWWQAPFVDRPLVSFENSTCKRFFYPNMTSCEANGVPSYEDQMLYNNAPLDKGPAWYTGDPTLDTQKIYRIVFWITISP